MDVEDGEIVESDEELPKDIPDNLEVFLCLMSVNNICSDKGFRK